MNNKKMRWGVFAPMALLLVATAVLGIAAPQWFYNIQSAVVGFAFSNFGWLFSLVVFVLIFVCLYLGFSKFGKIKIGGDGAKPNLSKWQWFAISLTSGIGTGILFWGTAEPLTHFMNPPDALGLEPGSEQAATFSIAAVTMQWTVAPYALYVICGIAIGYAHYNKGMPYAVSSALYPIFGKRALGSIGTVVDNVCMFAIAGAMSAILGEGVLQIGSGVSHYTEIVNGPTLWAAIAILITITYILSSYTGLQKGIKFLAEQNTRLFLLLLVFVLVVGPTAYIMTIGTQGTGKYLSDFAEMHLWFSPMDGESWPRDWPIFEWALWGANAPLIGMFIARVSYGRTIREFVTVNLLLPAAFGAFWFWVFGGSAMYFDWEGNGKLWDIINGEGGVPLSLFAFLDELPLSLFFGILMLIAIFISFTTLADSLTTTMSSLTTTGNDLKNPEPPAMVKIFWGGLIGLLAILTVTAGTGGEISGIDAVKQTATLAGFPVLFLIILISCSAVKYLRSDSKVIGATEVDDRTYAPQLES